MNWEMPLFVADISGIWRSIILICLILGLHFARLEPWFVVPDSLINKPLQRSITTLKYLCILLLISLPLNLQMKWWETQKNTPTNTLEILLDVSLSMSAKDVLPSRFSLAKDLIDQLTHKIPSLNVWVIAFSGIPLIRTPITSDIDALQAQMEETTLANFPPTPEFLWTALGDALLLALNNLEWEDHPNSSILLITDWDTSEWADPVVVAQLARDKAIPIYSLSIGDEMTILGTDRSGDKVIAATDSAVLTTVSEISKWSFYKIAKGDSLDSLITQLKGKIWDTENLIIQVNYITLNRLFLPITILLAILFGAFQIALLMRIGNRST